HTSFDCDWSSDVCSSDLMAKGLGADVTILDIDLERLRYLDLAMDGLRTMYSSEANLNELMPECDLLIGAVLLPGAKAPKLVTRKIGRASCRERGGEGRAG